MKQMDNVIGICDSLHFLPLLREVLFFKNQLISPSLEKKVFSENYS